jgi:hypothetical protein
VLGQANRWVVVRPDGYLGLSAPLPDHGAVIGYLKRFLEASSV